MNPYLTARKQPTQAPIAMTRIDLLLALYDGAIERLNKARELVRAKNRTAAIPLVARTQLIVTELAAGVRLDVDPDLGTNYLRLYEFVVDRLANVREQNLADALKILKTLREGFATIREEAIAMEHRGEFPSADRLMTLCTSA